MNLIVTIHTGSVYEQLAEITWKNNKLLYAKKHGYSVIAKTENLYGIDIGFEKIKFLIDVLEQNPEAENILWVGTDTMITNFDIKIEDKLSNTHDVIMTGDFNGIINCDVILLKNTSRSLAWLNDIMDNYVEYSQHRFRENQCMIDIMDKWKDVVTLMPQRYMNSYDYTLYGIYENQNDIKGNSGHWHPGDWIIHWPGTSFDTRITQATQYFNLQQPIGNL